MITSCSPGWVRYLEQHAPDMIRNISSCKSPQQMFGSLVKTYYAEQAGIDPRTSSWCPSCPAPPRRRRSSALSP